MHSTPHNSLLNRRRFLSSALAGATLLQARPSASQTGAESEHEAGWEGDLYSSRDLRPLAEFPEKAPLILLTDRPPQLETPLHYFRQDLTPNEAHFVRWHLAGIPTSVNTAEWRMQIGGAVNRPLELSLDDLHHSFAPVSLIALNQCSGNSRSLFSPRVPGGQWRHGAMGNARWTGVRLKDILDRAGVTAKAVEVSFRGLDRPPIPGISPFEKALAIDHARDGEVMVAYEMNGKPLPMLNGFPVRLVVPGWYATYWVKSLSALTVRDTPLDNFWTAKAYRIPDNADALEQPDHLAEKTVPINQFAVHSIFVSPEPGESVRAGKRCELQGLAMDAGAGIQRVEFSTDNGRTWSDARLDPELGRYSWRRWRADWTPPQRGNYTLKVRATNKQNRGQLDSQWNRSGYQRTIIEHMDVTVI